MTDPKEALEWYERKRVEARAMADRDCNNCKHNKPDGCSRWDCEYEPRMVEVVFCTDCRYCEEQGGHANCDGYLYCTWHKTLVDESCYCSWGERREP